MDIKRAAVILKAYHDTGDIPDPKELRQAALIGHAALYGMGEMEAAYQEQLAVEVKAAGVKRK